MTCNTTKNKEEVQRHWGDVFRYLVLLFSSTGFSRVMAEELAIIPGMEAEFGPPPAGEKISVE